jgi:hypothetical protein
LDVVTILDVHDMPPVTLESLGLIGRSGEVSRTFDGYFIVVENPDELAELLMSSDRCGFVRDPLHHISVRAEHISAVIYDLMSGPIEVPCQPTLCHSKAYRIGHALT